MTLHQGALQTLITCMAGILQMLFQNLKCPYHCVVISKLSPTSYEFEHVPSANQKHVGRIDTIYNSKAGLYELLR